MTALRRTGVYGGTFDPIHDGHVEVARRILKLFELDEVVFMPANVAPHKLGTPVLSAFHRYAMLALATQADERLKVSTTELDAPEAPYTVETIARLLKDSSETTRLFFIMGADSWSEFTTWRDWERLLALCDHVVVSRPGYELNLGEVPVAADKIVDVRECDRQAVASRLSQTSDFRVFVTDAVMFDVSATEVRGAARAHDGEQLRKLVPPPVADYIEKYHLYER